MTVDDAKIILSVWRPDGRDHRDPIFQEALDLARHDAGLLEWLQNQQDFDAMMVANLQAVRGPADGRREILAQGHVFLRRRAIRRRAWMSLAAAIVMVAAIGSWRYFSLLDPVLPEAPYTVAGAAEHLSVNHKAMEFYSDSGDDLVDWLSSRRNPVPPRLPGRLGELRAYGAQDWNTGRGRVSLLCFYPESAGSGGYSEDAEYVHLFVFPKQLTETPDAGETPRLIEGNQWVFVVWQDGDNAYALGLPAREGARERLRTIAGA